MENERPTAREIARKTLRDTALQGVLGSNQILEKQSLYGTLAVNGAKNTYNEAMNSEEARKFKDALYKQKQEKGKKLGVYGVPSINDYDVSTAIISQIEENKLRLPLRGLEDIVKNLGKDSGYNFELPKKLSNYVPAKLQEKMQIAAIKAAEKGKRINPEDVLNEEEKYALDVYEFLSEAYNRGVALKACNYFNDLNKLGEKIKENYEPKESKE
jgi:hypothetical protein